MSRMWVAFWMTDEATWIHVQIVSCSLPFVRNWMTDEATWKRVQRVSCSLPFMRNWMTDEATWKSVQRVSCSLLFMRNWMTNEVTWKNVQQVSRSLAFVRNRMTDEATWKSVQLVGCSLPFVRNWMTDEATWKRIQGVSSSLPSVENASRLWVALCLSCEIECLTKMCLGCELLSAFHAELDDWRGNLKMRQVVSCSPPFVRNWMTDETTWKSVQLVSCSLPFMRNWMSDENVSRLWVTLCPVYEIRWLTKQPEHIQQVSCSLRFKNWMTHKLSCKFLQLVCVPLFLSLKAQCAPNFIFPFLSSWITRKSQHSWWQYLMSVSLLFYLQLRKLIEIRNPLWPSSLVCLVSFLHLTFFTTHPLFLHYVAILIFLENYFWHQSPSVSFIEAFRKAFAMYKETGTQHKVEVALKVLDDSSGEKAFKSALLQILLEHRLRMLDYIFSSQLLLTILVPQARPDRITLRAANYMVYT